MVAFYLAPCLGEEVAPRSASGRGESREARSLAVPFPGLHTASASEPASQSQVPGGPAGTSHPGQEPGPWRQVDWVQGSSVPLTSHVRRTLPLMSLSSR